MQLSGRVHAQLRAGLGLIDTRPRTNTTVWKILPILRRHWIKLFSPNPRDSVLCNPAQDDLQSLSSRLHFPSANILSVLHQGLVRMLEKVTGPPCPSSTMLGDKMAIQLKCVLWEGRNVSGHNPGRMESMTVDGHGCPLNLTCPNIFPP